MIRKDRQAIQIAKKNIQDHQNELLIITWEYYQNLDWTYRRDAPNRSHQERSTNKSDNKSEENRQLEVSMHTFMVMAEWLNVARNQTQEASVTNS